MTQNCDCNKLDAYLEEDPTIDAVARFESHLDECATCREAIDEQRWIESLLQSPALVQLERTPATILDSVCTSAHRDCRILRAAYGLAAAAVLLIGLGWIALHRVEHPKASAIQDVAVVEATHVSVPVQPQATFVATTDAIVVPLESLSTDVTAVQVYPTIDTERRWRLKLTLTSTSTIPNGGSL
jgi:hypothetical protein